MRAVRLAMFWLAISILIGATVPTFVDSRDAVRATAAYSKNPSPENAAAVVRAQKKMQAMRQDGEILISVFLWSAGMMVYGLYRSSLRQFGRRRITSYSAESACTPPLPPYLSRKCP